MVRRPKLTQAEVNEIVRLLESGQTKTDVASQFSISTTAMNGILQGEHSLSPYREKKDNQYCGDYRGCPIYGACSFYALHGLYDEQANMGEVDEVSQFGPIERRNSTEPVFQHIGINYFWT